MASKQSTCLSGLSVWVAVYWLLHKLCFA